MTQQITATELRELIDEAAITQARAAELCHVSLRTMNGWLAPSDKKGAHKIPRATSELLCMALVAHRYIAPGPWLHEWVRPEFRSMIVSGALPRWKGLAHK